MSRGLARGTLSAVGSVVSQSTNPSRQVSVHFNAQKSGLPAHTIVARYADILDFFYFCDRWTGSRISDRSAGNRGWSDHGADPLPLVLVLGLGTSCCG